MKLAPLLPVETSSWSAQAFAIARQYEAVRKLQADFDAECDAARSIARGLTDELPDNEDCPSCGGEGGTCYCGAPEGYCHCSPCGQCRGKGTVRRDNDDEPTKVERKAITPGDDMP